MSVNKVIWVGNLGQDPDVKYTANGDAVVNLSVASSRKWTDKNTKEKREQTTWLRAVAFNRTGEICRDYLKKGSKVYIEGHLQTRSYLSTQVFEKDGTPATIYVTETVVDNIQMLDSKGNNAQANQQAQVANGAPVAPIADYDMDDIPF